MEIIDVIAKILEKCVQCIWNPATYSCQTGRYVKSIIDDSMITCDEIIERFRKFLYYDKSCSSEK